MNIRLGTDIVYIPRIQTAVERFGERFLERVYTAREQQDCRAEVTIATPTPLAVKQSQVSAKRLAGRWAAKEAIAKALGTGWQGIRYTDIEIQRQASGQPQVCLHGAAAIAVAAWGKYDWQLSLSHDGDYAIATAIAFCTSPTSVE